MGRGSSAGQAGKLAQLQVLRRAILQCLHWQPEARPEAQEVVGSGAGFLSRIRPRGDPPLRQLSAAANLDFTTILINLCLSVRWSRSRVY